jgi:hypothetical protein
MFSFLRKETKLTKPRWSLTANVYGLEDGYIYCSDSYNDFGLRHVSAPFGRVDIENGYAEKLGQCVLDALEKSGCYDPDFDRNCSFIFAGLSKHKGFQTLDHQSIRLFVDEQPNYALQISASDSTHRRAKIGTWPPPAYTPAERTALSIGQTIIEAERPYREIMMATKWKKKTAKKGEAPP